MTEPVGWNTTHFFASALVPAGADVLDVGCGPGVVGSALLRAGCSVVGVDADKENVDLSQAAGLEAVLLDIEDDDGLRPLGDRQFDVALCLDVLEHLRDPAPALRRIAQLVRPTGVIIVSIPNMTHAAVRVAMLEGRLERTAEGLLDRTHLRWYDRKVVEQLFATAGLEVLERMAVTRQADETEIPVDLDRVPDDVRRLLAEDPDAEVYQFVYVACVDRATARWQQPHPIVGLVAEIQRAAVVIRSATGYSRHVEEQLRAADVDRERLREALSGAEAAITGDERLSADLQDQLALRAADLDNALKEVVYFENELRFRDIQLVELRRQAAERDAELLRLHALVAASQEQVEAFAADAAWVREQRELDTIELRRLQAQEAELIRMRTRPGYRLADAVSTALRRNRALYLPARWIVRRTVGARGRPQEARPTDGA